MGHDVSRCITCQEDPENYKAAFWPNGKDNPMICDACFFSCLEAFNETFTEFVETESDENQTASIDPDDEGDGLILNISSGITIVIAPNARSSPITAAFMENLKLLLKQQDTPKQFVH
jgi:hypothetical protein